MSAEGLETEFLYTAGETINWYNHFGRLVLSNKIGQRHIL